MTAVEVPAGKKGHHSEFALSQEEIADLISFCTDKRTRGMITLAGLGVPMRWIVDFNSHMIARDTKGPFLHFYDMDPIYLSPKQEQLLSLFPLGFDVTNVTIWRRIRRAVLAARKEGVLAFDDDHIPYPAALARSPTEELPSTRQMMGWCLERVHNLQMRMPNQEFGTSQQCPHKDCERIRNWLRRKPE